MLFLAANEEQQCIAKSFVKVMLKIFVGQTIQARLKPFSYLAVERAAFRRCHRFPKSPSAVLLFVLIFGDGDGLVTSFFVLSGLLPPPAGGKQTYDEADPLV